MMEGLKINERNQDIIKAYLTVEQIVRKINQQGLYLVGVCGIPGAGKSTLSQQIHNLIPESIVLPMDGFHIYRKDLDEQGKRRRGAPFTFDLQQFKQKLLQLKEKKSFPIKFPSFDHALKDPIQDDIVINSQIKCVIIEGLYIFDKSLELDQLNFWDLKIFIDEYREICLPRVIKRCIEKKIQQTEQKAIERAEKSDKVNGDYVIQNTAWVNVWFVKNPDQE